MRIVGVEEEEEGREGEVGAGGGVIDAIRLHQLQPKNNNNKITC